MCFSVWIGFGKMGPQKSPFSSLVEILERSEIPEILENPQTMEN